MSGTTASCEKNIRSFEDYISNSKYIGIIYQSWVKSLPSELRLSKSLRNVRLLIGIIVQLSALSLFLFFLITGYENSQNASFLSLDKNAGDCYDIKISISNTYYVDYNGYWSTSPYYTESKSTFKIEFFDVKMNQDEYKYFTHNVLYPYLKNLGMVNKPWVENYLIWSKSDTFKFNYGGGKILVSIQGAPFSYKDNYYIQLTDFENGIPLNSTKIEYNAGTSSYDLDAYSSILKTYHMNELATQPDNSSQICEIFPNPGYADSDMPRGYGVLINYHENSNEINDYVMKPYESNDIYKIGNTWVYNYLSDEIKTDVYCDYNIVYANTNYIYFPIVGTGLFNNLYIWSENFHYDTSADCNVCQENMNYLCYDLEFVSIFIGLLKLIYPNNQQCKTKNLTTDLYSDCAFDEFYTQKAVDERANLNTKLFSLIDIYSPNYANDPQISDYINLDAVLEVKAIQFTASRTGAYKNLNLNGGLSAQNVELTCSDSLGEHGPFKPNSYVSNNPPTQLTENYYVCTPTTSSSFFDSLGIAVSNTGTFMGIFLTIVITGYVSWVKFSSKREITAISSDDIELMIDILGTALVNRSIANKKKQPLPPGVISTISNELIDEENAIEKGNEHIDGVELSSVKNPYLQQAGK